VLRALNLVKVVSCDLEMIPVTFSGHNLGG